MCLKLNDVFFFLDYSGYLESLREITNPIKANAFT